MSLPLIFSLAISALFASLWNWRRTASVLAAAGLLVTALVGFSPLPTALLAGLQVHDDSREPVWKRKNAIIVLGAGTVPGGVRERPTVELTTNGRTRVLRAAALYYSCRREKRDCRLFLSGGDPMKNGATEAAVMARALGEVGVPSDDMILEAESLNTFQNARNTAPLVRRKDFEQIVLTTSGTHMRRALLFFSFFLVQAEAAPSDKLSAYSAALPVSFNLAATDVAMHEYLGILQFHFYNYMGWNKKPET